ncbi:kinase-like domain-containing protein [Xylariomycetidae sp. FL0641]|nr:kinase-like domain-containing protein [Xylariomycetidae sp. FL0641]
MPRMPWEMEGVVTSQLETHFSMRPGWEFEKQLGSGAFGVTVLVRRRDWNLRNQLLGRRKRMPAEPQQRIAIKKGLDDNTGARDLRNEIRWLKRLRGSEHIMGLIASRDSVTDGESSIGSDNRPRSMTGRLRRSVKLIKRMFQKIQYDPSVLGGMRGPVMAIEYLQNGNLLRLFERANTLNILLPNRLLWSFFLCLVRACVAMAYPLEAPEGTPTRLETIPADGREPLNLFHNDLHPGNIMVGGTDARFPEHSFAPVMKFIDFGQAKDAGEISGTNDNVLRVSQRVIELITRQLCRNQPAVWNGTATRAGDILPPADGRPDPYPDLDPELRGLLARCLAEDHAARPTLAQMLATTERAVREKTADSFGPARAPYETDHACRQLAQVLFYDADHDAPGAGGKANTQPTPRPLAYAPLPPQNASDPDLAGLWPSNTSTHALANFKYALANFKCLTPGQGPSRTAPADAKGAGQQHSKSPSPSPAAPVVRAPSLQRRNAVKRRAAATDFDALVQKYPADEESADHQAEEQEPGKWGRVAADVSRRPRPEREPLPEWLRQP